MGRQGESARATCSNEILITLLNGEKTFEKIVEELGDKYSRGTINKYLNELFDVGLVTRKGRRGPYFLTPDGKKKAEALRRKQKLLNSFEELQPEKQEEYVRKLEKELKHYKRLAFLYEHGDSSLNFIFLPLTAVIKKLLSMGFELEDFFSKHELSHLSFVKEWPNRIPFHSKKLKNCFVGDEMTVLCKRDWDFSPDDIEIKLIPEAEAEKVRKEVIIENMKSGEKWMVKIGGIQELLDKTYGLEISPWFLLSEKPIRGFYILGAYKELLEIAKENVEYELSKWKERGKEEFELTDEDWNIIEPEIREMLENGCKPIEIIIFLLDYYDKNKRKNDFWNFENKKMENKGLKLKTFLTPLTRTWFSNFQKSPFF